MSSHSANALSSALFKKANTQIAAIFDSRESAADAVDKLLSETQVSGDQIDIISGTDTEAGRRLEHESEKLGKSMLRSHLWMGSLGVLAGLVIAWILVATGPGLTQKNPLFTFIALLSPGLFIGLFIAGLVNLRPDRSHLIDAVRHAIRGGKVAVLVNIPKDTSAVPANKSLRTTGANVMEAIR